ncbi:hypothetical protein B0E33_18650 [Roseibium algicola]|uniref:Major facilitator superfamily (MFS) profile domain-containing protein n=1 Tax=Roseibium algicola TaxID=2857014 RepID=A0ABN4X3A5_9HYPH|nr:hypothetical protein B0E33_18650 [Roseibium aggregatum]
MLIAEPRTAGSNKEFLGIVALLMAIAVLAINMILPAFDQISSQFDLSDTSRAGLIVSLLYLGLAIGQITLGPLSDSLGRRKALFIGVSVFMIGCIVSGMATNFETLIIGQIIQGIGLGAPRVITLAVLRDRFSGNSMARAMSFVMIMFVLAPTFAPFIGQNIVSIFGWKFLFVAYGILGASLLLLIRFRLPETLPRDRRTRFNPNAIGSSYVAVLKNRKATGYAVALGAISGPFIAYLNLSQEIFEFQYQLGKTYPIVFAILSLWIGAASLVNGLVVQKLGMENLSTISLGAIIVTSVVAFVATGAGSSNLPIIAFVAYMGVVLFCVGLLVSNLNAMAMSELSHSAGAGAAFIGALSTAISVPVAIFIGRLTFLGVSQIYIGFAVCGLLSLSVHVLMKRGF